MNRRDFLKVLRDASVAVPVMAVCGDTLRVETPSESVDLKPPAVVVVGGSIEWGNCQWGNKIYCGT